MYVYAIITTLLQIENNHIIIHHCGCRFFSKHMCFVRGSEEVRENCAFFYNFSANFKGRWYCLKGLSPITLIYLKENVKLIVLRSFKLRNLIYVYMNYVMFTWIPCKSTYIFICYLQLTPKTQKYTTINVLKYII